MVLDEYPEYSTQIVKEIICPFCGKGNIKVSYKPSVLRFTASRAACKTVRKAYRTKEKYEVLTEKCPNCGKSRTEIQRRLKEGKTISVKDAAKRAKEAGLPLKF